MIRKIYISMAGMIGLITLILLGNQVVIYQFQKASSKLQLEYHELYALQSFKASLVRMSSLAGKLGTPGNGNIDSLHAATEESKLLRQSCTKEVTREHLDQDWADASGMFDTLYLMAWNDFPAGNGREEVLNSFTARSESIIRTLNQMIEETRGEVGAAEHRNEIITHHGTLTLMAVGILFILLLTWSGIIFVRNLTGPMKIMLTATKQIGSGEMDIRVGITSRDEFGELATSFNTMLDSLQETTVSLEHVTNIVDSIFGALFVVDREGWIQSCNKVALKMLSYEREELAGKPVSILFGRDPVETERFSFEGKHVEDFAARIMQHSEIYTCNGDIIPVMTTCTVLRNPGGQIEGYVVVGHDITDKLEHEQEMEALRREQVIAIQEAMEKERSLIASDLHDGLGQRLAAISLSLEKCSAHREYRHAEMKYIQSLTDDAMQEVRSIAHSLIPAVLKDFGLPVALQELAASAEMNSGLKCHYNCYGWEGRIDPKLEKMLYRISQEALNNILKHAQGTEATIQLFKTSDRITLMVDDNGCGFDVQKRDLSPGKGVGLYSIRERVDSYHGSFTLNSAPGKGTELIIEIPYHVATDHGKEENTGCR